MTLASHNSVKPAVPPTVLTAVLLVSLPEPAATTAALVVGGRAGLGLVQLGESVLVGGVLRLTSNQFTLPLHLGHFTCSCLLFFPL